MPVITKKQAQLIAKHCKVVSSDKTRSHINDIAVIPEDDVLGTDKTVRVNLKKWKAHTQLITEPVDLLEFALLCAAEVQHQFPPYKQVMDNETKCKAREGRAARIQLNGRFLYDTLACAPEHDAARVYPPESREDPTRVFYEAEIMGFEAVVMPRRTEE